MAKGNIKSKKGFTIIEVVLVLAIAGLIFLMVFIALPALQSSQRNTQRENDLSRFLTAVTAYAGNNNGRIPFENVSNITNFITRYIDNTCDSNENFMQPVSEDACSADQFRDPDGNIYSFSEAKIGVTVGEDGSFPVTNLDEQHIVYFATGHLCGSLEATTRVGTGNRQVALYMVLEGGSVTCNDNG